MGVHCVILSKFSGGFLFFHNRMLGGRKNLVPQLPQKTEFFIRILGSQDQLLGRAWVFSALEGKFICLLNSTNKSRYGARIAYSFGI